MPNSWLGSIAILWLCIVTRISTLPAVVSCDIVTVDEKSVTEDVHVQGALLVYREEALMIILHGGHTSRVSKRGCAALQIFKTSRTFNGLDEMQLPAHHASSIVCRMYISAKF
jgi:hypothetical protein